MRRCEGGAERPNIATLLAERPLIALIGPIHDELWPLDEAARDHWPLSTTHAAERPLIVTTPVDRPLIALIGPIHDELWPLDEARRDQWPLDERDGVNDPAYRASG